MPVANVGKISGPLLKANLTRNFQIIDTLDQLSLVKKIKLTVSRAVKDYMSLIIMLIFLQTYWLLKFF